MCNYALRMNEAKQAAELYASGLSARQVAERFNVSQFAVLSALKLMNVERRPKLEARRMRNQFQPGPDKKLSPTLKGNPGLLA